MIKHILLVTYTIDDDGIWLQCSQCQWSKNLGHFVVVHDLVAQEEEHNRILNKAARR